jgi:hypothetical protein
MPRRLRRSRTQEPRRRRNSSLEGFVERSGEDLVSRGECDATAASEVKYNTPYGGLARRKVGGLASISIVGSYYKCYEYVTGIGVRPRSLLRMQNSAAYGAGL